MEQKGKVAIPEPDVAMAGGFLSELWTIDEELPKLQGWELYWYYLKEGFQSVLALPLSSTITVLTIAVSVFLLSGFLFVLQNVDRVLSEAGTTLYVTAYIKEDAPQAVIDSYLRKLETNPLIANADFISKEDALRGFKDQLGSRSGFLEGLEEDNPLPRSVDIELRPEAKRLEDVEATVSAIKSEKIIEEVVYGSQWVEQLQGVLKVFRLFGVVSLLVVLVIIMFLIANTIKLVIYARKDEISIMQLVGASDMFVKVPFILGGLIQGASGSALALFFLWVSTSILSMKLQNSHLFGIAVPELAFLGPSAVIGVLLVGIVVGAVGSFFALGRFMNV